MSDKDTWYETVGEGEFTFSIKHDPVLDRISELKNRRIREAEEAQNVKIDFNTHLLVGPDENGLETIEDQHGNKIILAPLSEEERIQYEEDCAIIAARDEERRAKNGG